MAILGAVCAALYRKAITGSLAALSCLIGLSAMCVFSAIAPMTQHNSIVAGWIIPPLVIRYWLLKAPISDRSTVAAGYHVTEW